MATEPLRSEQADAEWFRRLCTGSSSARALQNHLASIESRLDSNGAQAAIDQAVHNREAFLATLHHSLANNAPFPCGLASRIPKYVAIVNLSGKRLLLTSDNDILVRALCARSSRSTPNALAEQIHRFVLWVECALSPVAGSAAHTTAFALITYSLPWQAGLDAAYWEVNTVAITTRDDGKRLVVDRHISLTSLSGDTFSARPTLAARAIDDATRGAFAVQYVATNLDAHDDARVADDEDGEGAKMRRLRSVLEAMRAQTSKDREEIGTWKATVKIRNLLYGRSIAKADLKALKAEEEANRLRTTVQKLLIESADASKRADEAQRQVEKLRRQEGAKDKLTNAATAKQSNALRRLTDQLEAAQRAAAAEREEARRAHEREREAIVARAAQERAALQAALQFKERALNQLAEANEARSLDLEATRFELARAANERVARDVAASALRAELWPPRARSTRCARSSRPSRPPRPSRRPPSRRRSRRRRWRRASPPSRAAPRRITTARPKRATRASSRTSPRVDARVAPRAAPRERAARRGAARRGAARRGTARDGADDAPSARDVDDGLTVLARAPRLATAIWHATDGHERGEIQPGQLDELDHLPRGRACASGSDAVLRAAPVRRPALYGAAKGGVASRANGALAHAAAPSQHRRRRRCDA